MTEQINDEPAFPFTAEEGLICEGMTLRDYFAAKAMQSYLEDKEFVDACIFIDEDVKEEVARNSYEMADAMLKARES
jgi:hypothetical protein